jgi:hypothetical protein
VSSKKAEQAQSIQRAMIKGGGEESREVPRTRTVSTGLYLDSITVQQIAAG